MRIVSVRQLKPIQLEEGRFVFPLNSCTKIILDKKRPSNKKIHELLYQQGSHYGTVGDCCTYLSNDELLSLEAKGMIAIKKAGLSPHSIQHAYTSGTPYPCPACNKNLNIELDIGFDGETQIETYYAETEQGQNPKTKEPFELLTLNNEDIPKATAQLNALFNKVVGFEIDIKSPSEYEVSVEMLIEKLKSGQHIPIRWIEIYNLRRNLWNQPTPPPPTGKPK